MGWPVSRRRKVCHGCGLQTWVCDLYPCDGAWRRAAKKLGCERARVWRKEELRLQRRVAGEMARARANGHRSRRQFFAERWRGYWQDRANELGIGAAG